MLKCIKESFSCINSNSVVDNQIEEDLRNTRNRVRQMANVSRLIESDRQMTVKDCLDDYINQVVLLHLKLDSAYMPFLDEDKNFSGIPRDLWLYILNFLGDSHEKAYGHTKHEDLVHAHRSKDGYGLYCINKLNTSARICASRAFKSLQFMKTAADLKSLAMTNDFFVGLLRYDFMARKKEYTLIWAPKEFPALDPWFPVPDPCVSSVRPRVDARNRLVKLQRLMWINILSFLVTPHEPCFGNESKRRLRDTETERVYTNAAPYPDIQKHSVVQTEIGRFFSGHIYYHNYYSTIGDNPGIIIKLNQYSADDQNITKEHTKELSALSHCNRFFRDFLWHELKSRKVMKIKEARDRHTELLERAWTQRLEGEQEQQGMHPVGR